MSHRTLLFRTNGTRELGAITNDWRNGKGSCYGLNSLTCISRPFSLCSILLAHSKLQNSREMSSNFEDSVAAAVLHCFQKLSYCSWV